MPVRDGKIQQPDHETDDFARGEVLPGFVAALFREAPKQLFIDVTHLQPGELVRAEREFLVLIQDRGQPVVLHHEGDGGAVIEVLDDVIHVLREAIDVGAEVRLQQRVVFLIDRAERPVGGIGERALLGIQLQFLHQLGEFLLRELGSVLQHLSSLLHPPINKHALQTTNDNDGQDDALVFVGLELPAQPLGRFPDVGGEIVELRFVEREGHEKVKALIIDI